MTRGSAREYVRALKDRYGKASRREKGRILDEFTQVTGYHRKAAIRADCALGSLQQATHARALLKLLQS